MYTRTFLGTKLGQAALASVVAMTAMIALTSQVNLTASDAALAQPSGDTTYLVEMA